MSIGEVGREEVIQMAREAGFYNQSADYWDCTTKGIERFAALVAATKIEACAKHVEALANDRPELAVVVKAIADSIRAGRK